MDAQPGANGSEITGAARELARVLCEGLEQRRALGGLPAGSTPSAILGHEARSALRAYADLLRLPPLARQGRLGGVVRLARGALRGLLRPWLDVQSRYNRLALEVLESLHRELQELKAAAEAEYAGAVNLELGSDGRIASAGLWVNPAVGVQIRDGAPRVVSVSERILESIFVHTRLPPAPAGVLDLGCAESTNPLEMAGLGYRVVGVDLRPVALAHPSFAVVRADAARLPFADASFDVAVSLSTIEHVGLDWYAEAGRAASDERAVGEVARVLRPGSRFILTLPFGEDAQTPVQRIYGPDRLAKLLAPLRRAETLYGLRDGLCWSVTADADRAAQVRSMDRVNAVALVVAEKP